METAKKPSETRTPPAPAKLREFVKQQKVAWASVAREIGLPQIGCSH
jgi:hypothetical protein